jgi:hypothetical protein
LLVFLKDFHNDKDGESPPLPTLVNPFLIFR